MSEIGPEHPTTYRAELLTPLFDLLPAGESATVIAAASMGKSRLVQFMLREDVRSHYLGERAPSTLLVWVDCNRLGNFTAWHLYELLLDALLAAVEGRPDLARLEEEYRGLHLQVIAQENALLAQRVLERLARTLCNAHGLTLCLVLDEFDEAYQKLPAQALAGLRALRDANKYRLCYVLFTREDPAQLRDPADCEGLYEQFSRNLLYLQPYGPEDARRVIEQLVERRRIDPSLVTPAIQEAILALSGGHPGLMVALLSGLKDEPPAEQAQFQTWAMRLPKVHEECRKLYEGLSPEEQGALRNLVHGQAPGRRGLETLLAKGLVQQAGRGEASIFSPLFVAYLTTRADAPAQGVHLDSQTGIVTVDGVPKPDLTGLPYDLLVYLYERAGEVCSRDDIAAALYGSSDGVSDNRLDAVVTRLRQQIEPDGGPPRYLKTVRGRGFRLVPLPEDDS